MRSRLDVRLDPAFVASIKDLGVLVPIVAVRTAEGAVRVRFGNRRTLRGIEAGRPTVPVPVIADEGTDSRAQVERIVAQYVENTQRSGLTQSEEVSVVATLLDLGLSAAQALAIDLSTPHLPSPRTCRSPSPCARSVAADRPAAMAANDSDTAGHDRQMVDGCDTARDHGFKGDKMADQDQKRRTV
jgi:ParB-like chromosome segregation protein Spo0J